MVRFSIVCLVLALPSIVAADDQDAKTVAQDVLKKGAALYDDQDAMSLSATYTDDARLSWVERDKSTGKFKIDVKEGRSEIDKLYRDLFKDGKAKTTSRNTVEFAKFVAPDLLIIQGYFEPNINENGKYPFVQERVKQGDKWLIQSLRLYVVLKD
ncbi:MAG: hypothetical protein JWN86_392 [Planctomycetota bacterium]|nr:hypothetical protein [Planctomycetota bacterium]